MMDIREFEIRDQSAVIDLWNECQLVVPWNDPAKDIERKIKVDPDLFLVGELSGLIVATVMGGYEGHRGWINYLAVSPAHQRKGLGRAIMEQVEQRIRARGCPKINLQVRATNKAVIAFYESLGYNVDQVVGLGKRLESDL
ncbi:Acetyltransferase YpeA [Gimesia panareensis]|nr:GNAT family acetyltransferase [Gimesia panareensis]QDU48222.1 Acetyltransferase YpeA [Gimesia panareensis]